MSNALESALLVTLRDTIKWESALAPVNASGTLTPVDPVQTFDLLQYQRRDRELAFRDTINAAAVVAVAVEVSNVWNAPAVKPTMQGPQQDALPFNAQDARNLNSQVLHVKNVSIPYDAVQFSDRDLYGRDALIYETLARACGQTFTNPPISRIDASGTVIPSVTAWSLASGTVARADINSALAMSRDLFKLPDQNLADRDNQMAGYVAQLAQALKNPFDYATRLYVRISNTDAREVEVYSLIRVYYAPGTNYGNGDQVFYQTGYFQANRVTTDIPGTTGAWAPITAPTQRVWVVEPVLPNRNRIVYDTVAKTLQWFHEDTDALHVPQLYAMSIPGVLPGQTIDTLASVPERKDAQYWRQKASKVAFNGEYYTDIAAITNTASFQVASSLIQLGGASLTTPGMATFKFGAGSLPAGNYRVAVLVKPDAVVEIAGAQNTQGVGGTLGGATYGGTGTNLSWGVSLPPTQWSFQLDYTNLTGTTGGFLVSADLSGQPVIQPTVPIYFNDDAGNPLPNGSIVSSNPVPLIPNGQSQVVNVKWVSGNGAFHVRTLRFQTDGNDPGRYQMTGTLAGAMSHVDVSGANGQTDAMLFDFTTGSLGPSDCTLTFVKDAILPVRFLQAHLMSRGTLAPTAAAIGFEGFRNDCLERAGRCAQDSASAAFDAYGTATPTFCSTGNIWDQTATEAWMAFIETYEPRLRERTVVPSDQLVVNRQYQVTAGTVVYNSGTFVTGQSFIGSTGTAFTVIGAGTVKQVGAFKVSRAGHIGQPALVPDGLEYSLSAGTITANYDGTQAVPQLATLQPWMVEAGIYVAQSDFWSPSVV